MSVPDREQLIRQLAEALMVDSSWEVSDLAEAVFDALDGLGPASAPESSQERPEGSEATHTAERAVIVVEFDWPAHDAERAFQQVTHALMPLITSHINEDLHPQATIAIADVAERVIDAVRAVVVETEETPT